MLKKKKKKTTKNFVRAHLNGKNLDAVVCICHLSDSRRLKIEEWQSRSAWAKSEILSPK
jgi:hypothetical protein